MVRVINQETFDDVVRENIEDLDMNEEEALSSAVEQFKAQGVDLSNIIVEAGAGTVKQNLTKSLSFLKSSIEKQPVNQDDILKHLEIINIECNKGMSYRVLAGKLDAYKVLVDVLLGLYENRTIQVATLNTLKVLMTGYPDLLDPRGVDSIAKCLEGKSLVEDADTLCAALQWSHQCCIKDERNRQALIKRGVSDIVTDLFSKVAQSNLDPSEASYSSLLRVLSEICELVRVLVLDDDIRETVSRGHEHARSLALSNLVQLTELMKRVKEEPKAASYVVGSLSVLVVRNEFCETVDDAGGLECLWEIMVNFPDDERLNVQCLRLLKALAGNDRVKSHIVEKGVIPLIISAMRRYDKSQRLQNAACNVIAALALRNVPACTLLVDNEAPEAIVQAMKNHANVGSVQRPACLAIRNIVARSKDLGDNFLKLGVEELLNKIEPREGGDEAKAALRDLNCYVKFAEPFTGEVGCKLAN